MIYFILLNSSLTAREMVIHFLITIFVYMISITIHEFFHAFVAYKCGDPTAKLAGRMTLNPFSHLNLFGFIMFIFLGKLPIVLIKIRADNSVPFLPNKSP